MLRGRGQVRSLSSGSQCCGRSGNRSREDTDVMTCGKWNVDGCTMLCMACTVDIAKGGIMMERSITYSSSRLVENPKDYSAYKSYPIRILIHSFNDRLTHRNSLAIHPECH